MKILIVEDSKFVQTLTIRLIKQHFPDALIITAGDGEMGHLLFRTENPNIVITDLLMPKLSGQEMIRLIKQDNPDSKIIVLSADVQKIIKDELETIGILAFINKPLDAEKAAQLADIIKESCYA